MRRVVVFLVFVACGRPLDTSFDGRDAGTAALDAGVDASTIALPDEAGASVDAGSDAPDAGVPPVTVRCVPTDSDGKDVRCIDFETELASFGFDMFVSTPSYVASMVDGGGRAIRIVPGGSGRLTLNQATRTTLTVDADLRVTAVSGDHATIFGVLPFSASTLGACAGVHGLRIDKEGMVVTLQGTDASGVAVPIGLGTPFHVRLAAKVPTFGSAARLEYTLTLTGAGAMPTAYDAFVDLDPTCTGLRAGVGTLASEAGTEVELEVDNFQTVLQ